jgi:hypothetical protein
MTGEQLDRERGRLLLPRWLKGKEIGTALGFPKLLSFDIRRVFNNYTHCKVDYFTWSI